MNLLQKAWLRGSAWDSDEPDAQGIGWYDLNKITTSDKRGQAMIRSWQKFDANMDVLALATHHRPLEPDGIAGPATAQLADLPRCPVPDHAPPDDVDFGFLDPNDPIKRVFESYREFAKGTGSWPACDPQSNAHHSLRVAINTSNAPTKVKNYLPSALDKVSKAYAEIGLDVRYLLDIEDPYQNAEIVKFFERLFRGVIGWNQFPTPNTCNQAIDGRLDTNFTPDEDLWAVLEAHETGHGVGLQHSRGGIMNSSILRINPLTWIGDPRYNVLARYFGGEPIDVTPPPTNDGQGVAVLKGNVYRFKIQKLEERLTGYNAVFNWNGSLHGILFEEN